MAVNISSARVPYTTVGRVWLLNADGVVVLTADYRAPLLLRERELTIGKGVYVQTGQRHDGTWVYRYARLGIADTPEISDVRTPDDRLWDGPMPAAPGPTLTDARALVDVLLTTYEEPASVPRAELNRVKVLLDGIA